MNIKPKPDNTFWPLLCLYFGTFPKPAYTIKEHIVGTLQYGDVIKRYHHITADVNVSWEQASKECSDRWVTGTLAVLDGQDSMSIVSQYFTGYTDSNWLSGQQLGDDWAWLDGQPSPEFVRSPAPGEDCATVSSAMDFNGHQCSSTGRWFLCQVPTDECVTPITNCYRNFQNTSMCVISCQENTTEVSWYEARNLCLQRNGDLAILTDIILQDNVLSSVSDMEKLSTHTLWVGLRRKPWVWKTHQDYNLNVLAEIQHSFWKDKEPDTTGNYSRCLTLQLYPKACWATRDCHNGLHTFLCQEETSVDNVNRDSILTNSPGTTMENQTQVPTASNEDSSPGKTMSQGTLIIILSSLSAVLVVFVIVIVILVTCLRLARQRNTQSTSRKSYFDYFDVGFFRRFMPSAAESTQSTVMLTDTMIKDQTVTRNTKHSKNTSSGVKSNSTDTKHVYVNEPYTPD